ncbi:MAG: hypothetical protein Ct9H300mP25_10780 [Acidobacteriota bacterium]|nr:MAG: hypothetical protein Ct9H300mP25_10780 [Acidobacteriota bacterium]
MTNKTPPEGWTCCFPAQITCTTVCRWKILKNFDEQYPLNSRLVKREGTLTEEVYRINGDGRYANQLREVVRHLEAAVPFATQKWQPQSRRLCNGTGRESQRVVAHTNCMGG